MIAFLNENVIQKKTKSSVLNILFSSYSFLFYNFRPSVWLQHHLKIFSDIKHTVNFFTVVQTAHAGGPFSMQEPLRHLIKLLI